MLELPHDHFAFLCDRKQCQNCSYPECKHTLNPEHAINFHRLGEPYVDMEGKLTGWWYENEPMQKVESGLFDTTEVFRNCTVQVLRNTVTGETSVGWGPNDEPPASLNYGPDA